MTTILAAIKEHLIKKGITICAWHGPTDLVTSHNGQIHTIIEASGNLIVTQRHGYQTTIIPLGNPNSIDQLTEILENPK